MPKLLASFKLIKPGVNCPGVNCPGVNRPGVNCPGVNRPGVNCPGVNCPPPLKSIKNTYKQCRQFGHDLGEPARRPWPPHKNSGYAPALATLSSKTNILMCLEFTIILDRSVT